MVLEVCVMVGGLVLTEGSEIVSWPWLSLVRSLGSLTMISTGKFLHMVQHFILPQLNPFGLGVEREGWWSEHSVS